MLKDAQRCSKMLRDARMLRDAHGNSKALSLATPDYYMLVFLFFQFKKMSQELRCDGVPAAQRKITCDTLKEFQRNKQFCDAQIIVHAEDGKQFPFAIHRNILSAASPYFKAQFTNQFREAQDNEIHVPKVSPGMMQLIINYAYTTEAEVNEDNVSQILSVADRFCVGGLIKMCCDFMEKNLCVENCLGIRKIAQDCACFDLEKKALVLALSNFAVLSTESEEVLELNVAELCELLSNDELSVKNEEVVFNLIVRWIAVDEGSRIQHIDKLLNNVRLDVIPSQLFMEKIKSHPYIKNRCDKVVDEIRQRQIDLHRVPDEVLFVIGWEGHRNVSGHRKLLMNVVEVYDTNADSWMNFPTVQDKGRGYRQAHGCAVVNGLIYIIGGFNGSVYLNSVKCFNPVTKTWKKVAPMKKARYVPIVAALDGFVYAMGGHDGQTVLKSAEQYNPSENQWTLIQPMNSVHHFANATSLNSKIYVVGGFDEGRRLMASAESYDPQTNTWSQIAPMGNQRHGHAVITYHGCLYAVGGCNLVNESLSSAEKFDPATGQWSTICVMHSSRYRFAMQVVNDRLFAIGGNINPMFSIPMSSKVECYNDATDEWIQVSDMNCDRGGHSACVVADLPNILEILHRPRHILAIEAAQLEGGDITEVPSTSNHSIEFSGAGVPPERIDIEEGWTLETAPPSTPAFVLAADLTSPLMQCKLSRGDEDELPLKRHEDEGEEEERENLEEETKEKRKENPEKKGN
jgi:kelch-like protein 10